MKEKKEFKAYNSDMNIYIYDQNIDHNLITGLLIETFKFKIIKNPPSNSHHESFPQFLKDHVFMENDFFLSQIDLENTKLVIKFYTKITREERRTGSGLYDYDKYNLLNNREKVIIRTYFKCIKKLLFENNYHEENDNYKLKGENFKNAIISERSDNYDPGPYNKIDRDKKELIDGQIKYFRDYNGKLGYGEILHNINNMWWVLLPCGNHRNISTFSLFDLTEDDLKHRRIKAFSASKRKQIARYLFKSKKLSYSDITEGEILSLTIIINKKLKEHRKTNSEMRLTLSKKIDIKKNTNGSIKYAFLYCNGSYFKKREAISFNRDGFIGFAGWASFGNSLPFIEAFEELVELLTS